MSTGPRPSEPAAALRGEPAAGGGAVAGGRLPGGAGSRPVAAGAAPAADPERALRTCPNCGRELAERGCKLRCPDPACGYFLSCAEYH